MVIPHCKNTTSWESAGQFFLVDGFRPFVLDVIKFIIAYGNDALFYSATFIFSTVMPKHFFLYIYLNIILKFNF